MFKFILIGFVLVASANLFSKQDEADSRFLGKSLDEIKKDLGLPILSASKLSDGREILIFIDHQAEARALKAKDDSLQKFGIEVVMRNRKVVEFFPIYGRITLDHENQDVRPPVAALYALSDKNGDSGFVVSRQGDLEYKYNSSMPSASMVVGDLKVVVENKDGGLVFRLSCELRDIPNIIEFTEKAVGRKVAILVGNDLLCIGHVSFLAEIGEVEIVAEKNATLSNKLAEIRKETSRGGNQVNPTGQP